MRVFASSGVQASSSGSVFDIALRLTRDLNLNLYIIYIYAGG